MTQNAVDVHMRTAGGCVGICVFGRGVPDIHEITYAPSRRRRRLYRVGS
jgi:hypothetical protein